jgi:hypothetical protein
MRDDSGRVLADIRTSQRVAEEHDALENRARHWTLMLLYPITTYIEVSSAASSNSLNTARSAVLNISRRSP